MPKETKQDNDYLHEAVQTVAELSTTDLTPIAQMWTGYMAGRPEPSSPLTHVDVLAMLSQYNLLMGVKANNPHIIAQSAGLNLLIAEELKLS